MFAALPAVIPARDLREVASGRERAVHVVAGAPGLLAKLARSDGPTARAALRREARMARLSATRPGLPIARTFGVWPTALGDAILVEAIVDRDGDLVPTLAALRDGPSGTPPDVPALLTRFVAEARAARLPVIDGGLGNFVIADGARGRRILMIDGYGDDHPVPLYHWSDRLNDRQIARRFYGVADRLSLRWDPRRWRMT